MKRRYEAIDPDIQRTIAAESCPGVRGFGAASLAQQFNLPLGTVKSVLKRAKLHGDPVTARGHRGRKLDERQEARLQQTLDAKPFTSNRDLAAAVGGVIATRTVSDYLARADPPFTAKVAKDQEPEELSEDWKAAARTWLGQVRRIAMSRRVYADETGIYANEALKRGRSRKGKPIFRARPRWANKYTLHVFATKTGVVYWELCEKNADTKEVERIAAAAAERMKTDDVLIWDRLGRSGRAANPTAQHYSPVAIAAFRGRGVHVRYLPPKGKYFNPVELLFADLKTHYIRPAYPVHGGKMSFDAIHAIVEQYMQERAPATLPGFFKARANGATAIEDQLL